MEPDFVTRQHIDSVHVNSDPETNKLLNRYKFPPINPQRPQAPQPQVPMGTFPVYMGGGNSDAVMLSNMLGQLQGTLNQQQPRSSGLGGLNLNIDSDVLKWLLLLVVVVILIWLILKAKTGKKKSPMAKRMKKMEKEMRMLRKNPELLALHRKTKIEIPDDDYDDIEDDDDDDE